MIVNAFKTIGGLVLVIAVYAAYLYVTLGLVILYRVALGGSLLITVTMLAGAATLPIIAVALVVIDEKREKRL